MCGLHETRVGIFWLVRSRLIIDCTPLSAAERYGDRMNHPHSHIDDWAVRRSLGDLPRDTGYEEHPRGRVVYNLKTGRYSVCRSVHPEKEVRRHEHHQSPST